MLLLCILKEKLLCLKRKFSSDQLTEESVQRDLTVKIQQVKQKTQDLRQQLGQMQTATKKQLLDVTIRSNEASKKLQAIVAKVRQLSARLTAHKVRLISHSVCVLVQGQKVLRVARLCHQLESQQGVSWFCLEEADTPQVRTSLSTSLLPKTCRRRLRPKTNPLKSMQLTANSEGLFRMFGWWGLPSASSTPQQQADDARDHSNLHGNRTPLTSVLCPPGAGRVPGAAAAAEEVQQCRVAATSSEEAQGRPQTGKPEAETFAASAPGCSNSQRTGHWTTATVYSVPGSDRR